MTQPTTTKTTAGEVRLGDGMTVDRIRGTVVHLEAVVRYPRNSRAGAPRSCVRISVRPDNRARARRELVLELTAPVTVRRVADFEVIA